MKQEHCPTCDSIFFGDWCPYCVLRDCITAAKDDDAKLRNAEAEIDALRAQVEELEAENDDIRSATMDYIHEIDKLTTRATRAEAKLAKVREVSALLVVEEIQRAQKAEAERDEAKGKCERLRDDILRLKPKMPYCPWCGVYWHLDGEVGHHSTCGYRTALAECGEG